MSARLKTSTVIGNAITTARSSEHSHMQHCCLPYVKSVMTFFLKKGNAIFVQQLLLDADAMQISLSLSLNTTMQADL